MKYMTDAELTILSHLADVLVVKPKDYAKMVGMARDGFRRPSKEFLEMLDFITRDFDVARPQNTDDVRRMVELNKDALEPTRRMAAEVLSWGLAEL